MAVEMMVSRKLKAGKKISKNEGEKEIDSCKPDTKKNAIISSINDMTNIRQWYMPICFFFSFFVVISHSLSLSFLSSIVGKLLAFFIAFPDPFEPHLDTFCYCLE